MMSTDVDMLQLDRLDRGVASFAPKTSNSALIRAALAYLPRRLADIAVSCIASGTYQPVRGNVAMIS
jgi:hypothetical protein